MILNKKLMKLNNNMMKKFWNCKIIYKNKKKF